MSAAKESVKDQIAGSLREDGMDFMSAYEEATRVIKDFIASGQKKATYTSRNGKTKITIERK